MKIEVMFPRTMSGQKTTTIEVAQIPHDGENIHVGENDGVWLVCAVIHYADYKKGAPVAQVRVK